MITTQEKALEVLTNGIRSGHLTKGVKVDYGTMVCFVEHTINESLYFQYLFEELPMHCARAFLGKTQGDTVDKFKIVGVLDVWEQG